MNEAQPMQKPEDAEARKYMEEFTAEYNTLGVVVVGPDGQALSSTFDFGKTQVYCQLVWRIFSMIDRRIVREIDSTDATRFVKLVSARRELLIAPSHDRVVAVFTDVAQQ